MQPSQGRARVSIRAAALWFVPALLASCVQISRASEQTPSLEISSPVENAEVAGPVNLIEVSGLASPGPFVEQDLVVVVDVSSSTLLPSGVDVNGNGRVGRETLRLSRDRPVWLSVSTDPGDSVRAAEFFAAHRLLDAVDSRRTRVGLVVFEARVRKSLSVSAPREQLEAALHHFQEMDADLGGNTNFAVALREALKGLEVAPSGSGEVKRARHVIFLSDGMPNEPAPMEHAAQEALAAAGALRDAGADILAFVLGHPEQEGGDLAVYSKMSELTGGSMTRLPNPADVIARVPRIDLVGITAVDITNQTTGEAARALRLGPDGSFDGFVSLQPGENWIRVRVHDREGRSAELRRLVVYSPREPKDPEEARRFDEAGKFLLEKLRARSVEVQLVHEIEQARSQEATQDRELELRRAPEQETPSHAP